MMDFLSDDVRRNPFAMYDQVRASSPVLHVAAADLWMIFDYEGVKRVLTDHDTFRSSMEAAGRSNPPWFIFFDPPRHTKLRALVMRAFTGRMIAGLEPRIRRLSRELLDPTLERGEMDLAEEFSIQLPMMVIAEMLGVPADDRPRFRHWSDVILQLSYTVSGGAAGEAASNHYATATAEMRAYLDGRLAERRAQPRDDLLTRLVDAEVDGERLTAEEILGFFQLLLIAGTETTTNLINNWMICCLDHPEELRRLRATPELLPSAIEEVLRFRSPVQWMFRATNQSVELHGQRIPAGTLVLPVIGAANRDPAQFPGANRFDITREPNPHIAFGHGAHFCLGAPLSRLEARIAIGDLLAHLDRIELATDGSWEPRRALHVHGPASLPIRFEPRAPAGRG